MPRGTPIANQMTGEEMKEARAILGLTQQELADALNLENEWSRDTVRFWEKGKRDITGPVGVAVRLMVELHQLKEARKRPRKAAA